MTGGASAFGAYLPDTYEVYWNASAATIAEKLYQNTVRFWSEDRIAQAAALGLTPAEASTLASIVMKESSKSDDRPRVARLYLNRLEKGMKLQADPTVIYAIKRANPGAKVRRVLKKDLSIEDPYNTYYVKGLPPGPICVPEKAALLAVLNAPEHDYIFMCANPDQPGYHAFAKNYAGHLVNQRKWTLPERAKDLSLIIQLLRRKKNTPPLPIEEGEGEKKCCIPIVILRSDAVHLFRKE